MTNTTETYWDVDGVSLQTYAMNIQTIGGDRMAPPEVRGDDLTVPFRPGDVWVPKVPASRTITLGMWIQGAEEDGSVPEEDSARQKFHENWRQLRSLLFRPRRQLLLTKRFWVLEDDLDAAGVDFSGLTREGNYRLYEASANASYAGGLVPLMQGVSHASFTVDLKLSDPYFYSEAIEVAFDMTGTTTRTIEVLGDDRTMAIGVDFVGPLTGGRITNSTYDVWMRYNTALDAAEIARIGVWDFDARHDVEGDNTKAAGYVEHDGDAFWLYLEPGENELVLTALGGTGTATLSYQPGWF